MQEKNQKNKANMLNNKVFSFRATDPAGQERVLKPSLEWLKKEFNDMRRPNTISLGAGCLDMVTGGAAWCRSNEHQPETRGT